MVFNKKLKSNTFIFEIQFEIQLIESIIVLHDKNLKSGLQDVDALWLM